MQHIKRLMVFLLICYSITTLAQQSVNAHIGSIKGKVVDAATKQPLVGANIYLIGTEYGASSNINGVYLIENVAEDIYKLRVDYIGYQGTVKTDVRVIRNKVTYLEELELVQSAVEGEAVIITESTSFGDDAQAPVSAFGYSREEIRRAPGASGDVLRAIETLPGVSSGGGEFSSFSVRGGSPKENIILVDNIPFDKVTHFSGGSSEEQEKQGGRFSIFAPNLIEDAKFQAGGFSSIYGGKFSSFLDLTLKQGNQENFTLDGRLDVIGWEVNYDGPLQLLDNSGIIISARRHDFTRILELTGQEEFGSPRFTDIIVKSTTDINSRHRLSLLGFYTPENFDRRVEDVFESDDFAANDLVSLEEDKSLLGANWRWLTGKTSYLQSSVFRRASSRTVMQGRARPIYRNGNLPQSEADFRVRNTISEEIDESELGSRTVFNYVFQNGSMLTSGFEISNTSFDLTRQQDGLDTLYVFDQNDFRANPAEKFLIVDPAAVNNQLDDRMTLFAGFSEFSFRPFSALTLNSGIRYEYNQFNREHYFSPRFSISTRLNSRTRLSAAAGIYYQNPEFVLVTADPRNIGLKNERAIHMILGFSRYLSDDLKLTAETYYKQFDDLIVRNDRTSLLASNAGEGWATGIDLSLIKRFVNKFYGQINYSYAESRRNDRNGEGWYDADFNQPHVFNILGGYEFNKEWSIAAKWKYATGRPADSFIIHENIFNDPAVVFFSKEITDNNGSRLPDFHTFNIRIDYRKQFNSFALVSFLDIVNVYNYLNVNEERFLELTGDTDSRGFQILPTAGVKLEL